MGTSSIVSQLRLLICRASIVSKIRAIVLGAREIRPNKSRKRGETTSVAAAAMTTPTEKNGDSEKTELGVFNSPAVAMNSTRQQQSTTSFTVVQPHQPVSFRYTLARGIVNMVAGWDDKTRGARSDYRELATPAPSTNSLEASGNFPRRSESSLGKEFGADKNDASSVAPSEMPRSRSVSFNKFVKAMPIETREQRYGDLETKRAAFYSQSEVAQFKKALSNAMALNARPTDTSSCSKRDWLWQPQPSSLDSARRTRPRYWRERGDFGGVTVRVEVGDECLAPGEYSRWIWNSSASE